MPVGTIALTAGTFTAPSHPPIQADGTSLETNLAASTANTAAGTGDLDANQGIAWSVQSFAELNQVVGIFAQGWACAPAAAIDRLIRDLTAMRTASNTVPTAG